MASPATHTPDQRLWSIVGRWRISGQVIGEPTTPIMGGDVYDVLPRGGNFLVHYVDMTVGDQQVQAIEIIGERTEARIPGMKLRRCGRRGNDARNDRRRWCVPLRTASPGWSVAGGLGPGQVSAECSGEPGDRVTSGGVANAVREPRAGDVGGFYVGGGAGDG